MKKFILKAIISFLNATDANLLKAMNFIAKSLDDNAATFTVTPTAKEGILKLDEFQNATTAAESGDHVKIAHRNAVRIEVEDMGRSWANQVEVIAKNDPDTFVQSGYKFRKKSGPSIEMQTPVSPKVKRADLEGSVKLKAKHTYGSRVVQFRYTTADPATATPADYVVLTQSSNNAVVKDLMPGKMYFFSVRVTGAINTSDWSTPTAFRAY